MYKISVVIPTLNRSRLLARTIDHIESQSLPRDQYEVIVVDNNSTDDTRRVLEERARTFPNFRFSSQAKPGAAATRNMGLRMASGDIVVFIDDDIEADTGLLEAHLQYHQKDPGASVIGAVRSLWQTTSDPFLRYLRDRGIFNPYSLAGATMDFACYHTGNVSTARNRLLAVGGFDERFSVYGMEDIELGYRLESSGSHMVHGAEAAAVHHYFPSYEQFILRCEQAGYSLGLMLRLHPELRRRFTENGRMTRMLRPLHRLYCAASTLIEPMTRTLAAFDAQRGTGPVTGVLGFHYTWALRYHFFIGYSRFMSNGHSRLEPVSVSPPEERPIEKSRSKIQSSSVARS